MSNEDYLRRQFERLHLSDLYSVKFRDAASADCQTHWLRLSSAEFAQLRDTMLSEAPAPVRVNGFQVVAFVRLISLPGEVRHRGVVVVDSEPKDFGFSGSERRFTVWNVNFHGQWIAEMGAYDATWQDAFTIMTGRVRTNLQLASEV